MRKKPGHVQTKRELRYKIIDEDYAFIQKTLGNCRFMVMCNDGITRLAHVRGAIKKRTRCFNGIFPPMDILFTS